MIKRAATLVVAVTMALGGLAALVVTGDLAGAQRPPQGEGQGQGERAEGQGQRPPEGERRGEGERRRKRGPRPHMGRAVHGDLIVRGEDGTFVPMTFDRGTVVAKEANAFTIERPDGVSVRLTVAESTRYRGIESFGQLEQGQPAMVTSRDGVALVVAQPTPEQRQKMEERHEARQEHREAGEGERNNAEAEDVSQV